MYIRRRHLVRDTIIDLHTTYRSQNENRHGRNLLGHTKHVAANPAISPAVARDRPLSANLEYPRGRVGGGITCTIRGIGPPVDHDGLFPLFIDVSKHAEHNIHTPLTPLLVALFRLVSCLGLDLIIEG